MKLCCHNMGTVGLVCQHEQQQRPDTFTVEEVRKYISSSSN